MRLGREESRAESSPTSAHDESAERELVRAFVERRSERAFRELYRRHTPRLHQFVVRLRGDASRRDAEDVLQETWLRAARSLPDFRFDARLRTWLIGIALNVCREMKRQSAIHTPVVVEEAAGGVEAHPDRQPLQRLDLEEAIAALPAGFRQVLLLHDLEGHTHREIARLLGIEVGTSKSQLARARAALRGRWRGATSAPTRNERET